MPGKGKLSSTGKLGDVMKESIEAAMTVVRARGQMLGIEDKRFELLDVHLHVPEGATPKDGPSAGIAITTALVSALTKIPVKSHVAMTGEITLRGEVLPIGGLKEKLLAALRGGIKTVLIPHDNVRDLKDVPMEVKNNIEIHPVRWIDEVLSIALTQEPIPLSVEGLSDNATFQHPNAILTH
jgi:ATP-dependent Lon protease